MSSVMCKSPLTTCIFFYLTLLDVKCHVHDATLPHINKNTYLMVVDAMDHVWLPFVFGSTTERTSWKTWPRWLARDDEDEKKEAWVGKRSGITFFPKINALKCRIPMIPKKGPRPLVNTKESWCCKWNGNCENAAKRKFFERSLMDQCANLPGSLLAPVPCGLENVDPHPHADSSSSYILQVGHDEISMTCGKLWSSSSRAAPVLFQTWRFVETFVPGTKDAESLKPREVLWDSWKPKRSVPSLPWSLPSGRVPFVILRQHPEGSR